jgi:hypothetical protein
MTASDILYNVWLLSYETVLNPARPGPNNICATKPTPAPPEVAGLWPGRMQTSGLECGFFW